MKGHKTKGQIAWRKIGFTKEKTNKKVACRFLQNPHVCEQKDTAKCNKKKYKSNKKGPKFAKQRFTHFHSRNCKKKEFRHYNLLP
jgi:hypothetical protein